MMRGTSLLVVSNGLKQICVRQMSKPPVKGCGTPPTTTKQSGSGATPPPGKKQSGCGGSPPPATKQSGCGGSPPPVTKQSGCGGSPPPATKQSGCGGSPSPATKQSGCGGSPPPATKQSGCGGSPPPATKQSGCGGSPPSEAKKTNCGSQPAEPKKSVCDTAPPNCSQMSASQACRPPSIAINGFGRIGKCLLRLAIQRNFNVVAVNQPFTDAKAVAHSFKHDTVHGPFVGTVFTRDSSLCINGRGMRILHEEKPENIKWKDVDADYVIDATGMFTEMDSASKHIAAGAKKVIVSAPSKDIPMFVKGVNFDCYKKSMNVVSNASCTTNCAAPLIHIMHKKFGVLGCLLTTAHSVTSSQHVHDGVNYRSAVGNIVPSSTGAAKAVGMVIPELKGKVDGDSVRVPILDVSLLKLYMNLRDNATLDAIKCEIKAQTECSAKGLIAFFEDMKFVSSDFIGTSHSAVIDFNQIQVIDKFVTIGAWYDNEMGYSNRVLDLVQHMIEMDEK